jgi:hypothetical protein
MDQTYNPHEGGENFGRGHGWQIFYTTDNVNHTQSEMEKSQTTLSYDTCKMVLHHEMFPVGSFSDMHTTSIETFNLRNIDLKSIRVISYDPYRAGLSCSDPDEVKAFQMDCRSFDVEFNTRDGAPAIADDSVTIFEKLQGSDHESRSASKTSQNWFTIDDPQYVERFTHAFKHAVELCGGKASKF